jgi:hypothetical protein
MFTQYYKEVMEYEYSKMLESTTEEEFEKHRKEYWIFKRKYIAALHRKIKAA